MSVEEVARTLLASATRNKLSDTRGSPNALLFVNAQSSGPIGTPQPQPTCRSLLIDDHAQQNRNALNLWLGYQPQTGVWTRAVNGVTRATGLTRASWMSTVIAPQGACFNAAAQGVTHVQWEQLSGPAGGSFELQIEYLPADAAGADCSDSSAKGLTRWATVRVNAPRTPGTLRVPIASFQPAVPMGRIFATAVGQFEGQGDWQFGRLFFVNGACP